MSLPPPKRAVVHPVYSGMNNAQLIAALEKSNALVNDLLNRSGADSKDDLPERLTARIFSSACKPQEPQARFHLAGVSVCTPGNLTAVSAAPKTGKSAAIGGMIAATFADNGRDCLGWASDNSAGLAVVHFDTEQCPFDHWQLINRAVRRAGVSAPDWLRSYCVTGFSHAEIRAAIPLALDKAAQEFGGLHSFILDGVADGIGDVNSPEESNEFVSELHALAIQYDCPVIGVIHLNPGSQKTRGHLGSQLERKAETNLQLEQDDDGITTIWASKNRRASIPKKTAPCFAWDDSRHMHATVENPAEAKADARSAAKQASARESAGHIFAQIKKAALSHGELVQQICKSEKLKPSGSRRRVETWLNLQVVTKNEQGFYQLSE